MLEEIIKISLIGGLLNLDDVPVLQIMVSQPIVAAPIIGWLGGDLQLGLIIGSFLELMMIYLLPIGCSVPLDASIASIIATGASLLLAPNFPGSRKALIALTILVALPFSVLAQRVSIIVRRLNGKISDLARSSILEGNLSRIDILHVSGIGLFFIRSFGLCLVSLLVLVPVLEKSVPLFPSGILEGFELLYYIYPLIGIALIFDIFRNRAMYIFFVLSFLSAAFLSTVCGLPAWLVFTLSCLIWGFIYGIKTSLGR